MSAYIVNKATLDAAVSMLLEARGYDYTVGIAPSEEVQAAGDRLGSELWLMNEMGVEARYPGRDPNSGPVGLDYTWDWWAGPWGDEDQRAQVRYSVFRCFLYQCDEGNIPELPLFQECQSLLDNMAHDVARRATRNAPWGLE